MVYNLHSTISFTKYLNRTNHTMRNLFLISVTVLLKFCIAKNQGGNWEDDTCFDDNFGHLINVNNTSKIYPDDIMVKIKYEQKKIGLGF